MAKKLKKPTRLEWAILAVLSALLVLVIAFVTVGPYVTYLPQYGTFDQGAWASGSKLDRAIMLEDLASKLPRGSMTRGQVVEMLGPPDVSHSNSDRWKTTAVPWQADFVFTVEFSSDDNGEFSENAVVFSTDIFPQPHSSTSH